MLDHKFVSKWERKRQIGKVLYIVLICFIMVFSSLIGIAIVFLATDQISVDTSIGVIIGEIIGGVFGGILHWNINEEKYKKLKGL